MMSNSCNDPFIEHFINSNSTEKLANKHRNDVIFLNTQRRKISLTVTKNSVDVKSVSTYSKMCYMEH